MGSPDISDPIANRLYRLEYLRQVGYNGRRYNTKPLIMFRTWPYCTPGNGIQHILQISRSNTYE